MKNNSTQKIILKIISIISTIIAIFGVPLIGMPIIVLIIIVCLYVVFILYNIVGLCILSGWKKKIRNEINQLKKDIEKLDYIIESNNSIDLDEAIGLDDIIDLNDTDSEKEKEEKKYKEIRYEIRREEKKKIKEIYKNNIENLKIASCVAAILCILNYKPLYTFSQKMVLFAKEQLKTVEADKGSGIAETKEELGTTEADKGSGIAETEEAFETEADTGSEIAETEEEPETTEADTGSGIAETEEAFETEADTGSEIAETEEELETEAEESEVVINEEKDAWVVFKLEHPEGYPGITDNEFNELCDLVLYLNEDNLEEKIKSEITVWKNGCTDNSLLDNVVTSSGKSTTYFSNIEKTFSNEDGKTLSSNLLDEVIAGRGELMDLSPNGTLAWLLANFNQTYALNYLHQTDSERSILYFYMKSIYHTQKSLEFEMSSEAKEERINYIKNRYKDISECILLDDSVRLRALEIFVIINDNTSNEVE